MDIFTITLIVIIITSFLTAFIKNRRIDRCLKDFNKYKIKIEFVDGEEAGGRAKILNTGIEILYQNKELLYPAKYSEDIMIKKYLIYKKEYQAIYLIKRPLKDLTENEINQRNRQIKKNIVNKVRRPISNFFKSIRDSLLEVSNLILGYASKNTNIAKVIDSQKKYVKEVNKELIYNIDSSYEALLERSIGEEVILIARKDDEDIYYSGILKEYSNDFIELFDVKLLKEKAVELRSDIIFPRSRSYVRYVSGDNK